MALTIYEVNASGGKRAKVINVTFDSSYPTGGLAITPAQCSLSSIDILIAEQPVGYQVQYVSGKLVVRNATASHVHVENAAGSYTQSANTAGTTAVPGTEVSNTTDLSTLQVRCLVVGTL